MANAAPGLAEMPPQMESPNTLDPRVRLNGTGLIINYSVAAKPQVIDSAGNIQKGANAVLTGIKGHPGFGGGITGDISWKKAHLYSGEDKATAPNERPHKYDTVDEKGKHRPKYIRAEEKRDDLKPEEAEVSIGPDGQLHLYTGSDPKFMLARRGYVIDENGARQETVQVFRKNMPGERVATKTSIPLSDIPQVDQPDTQTQFRTWEEIFAELDDSPVYPLLPVSPASTTPPTIENSILGDTSNRIRLEERTDPLDHLAETGAVDVIVIGSKEIARLPENSRRRDRLKDFASKKLCRVQWEATKLMDWYNGLSKPQQLAIRAISVTGLTMIPLVVAGHYSDYFKHLIPDVHADPNLPYLDPHTFVREGTLAGPHPVVDGGTGISTDIPDQPLNPNDATLLNNPGDSSLQITPGASPINPGDFSPHLTHPQPATGEPVSPPPTESVGQPETVPTIPDDAKIPISDTDKPMYNTNQEKS